MTFTARTPAFTAELPAEVASLSYPQLHDQYTRLKNDHAQLHARVTELQAQLTWLQNQLFGRKSEQRFADGESRQLSLGEGLESLPATATVETIEVRYERKRGKQPMENAVNEAGLRFDPGVPVQEIRLNPPEIKNLNTNDYDVIDEEVSHRLAQRPGAYVVIKTIRPVVKLKACVFWPS